MQTSAVDAERGKQLLGASSARGLYIGDILDQYIASKWSTAQATFEHSAKRYARGRTVATALTAGAIALAILMAFVVGRSISRPLQAAVEVLERVARGDLSGRVEIDRKDEIGVLARTLNESLDSIRSTLVSVLDVSENVAAVSTQLAASAEQISSGA